MKKQFYFSLLFTILLFSSKNLYAQSTSCDTATPFCTDIAVTYPAGVSGSDAAVGADYGCLSSQPNPAWFYLQVGNPGTVELVLNMSNSLDLDFAIWGPFAPGSDIFNICTQISTGSITPSDCSYAGGIAPETPEITGTVTGELFVLVVTNFSQTPTDVTISQLSGSGSTNCELVNPTTPEIIPEYEYTPVLAGTEDYSKGHLEWSRPIDTTGTLPTIQEFEVYITEDEGITYTLAALTSNYSISLDLINGLEYGFRVRPIYVVQEGNNYLPGNYSNIVYLHPSIILNVEEEVNSKISLYPNPSEGNFTLQFKDIISQKSTIKVTDLTGKIILIQNLDALNGNSSHSISLPNTKTGMYIIQVETEKGIYQQKISVIR